MTPDADSGSDIDLMAALEDSLLEASKMPTIHGYYKRQGFESCPRCGEWLLPPTGSLASG